MFGFRGALCAIAFGAIIGTVIAIKMEPMYVGIWFVGAVMAGAIAYAGYDYATTWKAITSAFKLPYGRNGNFPKGLMTDNQFYNYVVSWTVGLGTVCFDFIVAGIILHTMVRGVHSTIAEIRTFAVMLAFMTSLGVVGGLGFSIAAWSILDHDYRVKQVVYVRRLAFYANPFVILIYGPMVGLKMLGKVVKLIRSYPRAFCFLFANIGAAAGYFLGHEMPGLPLLFDALVGAVAGVVLATIAHATILAPAPILKT